VLLNRRIKMEHGLNYRTLLGGWVCKCQRYFDNEKELNEHIKRRG